jgi:peroxiredoxin
MRFTVILLLTWCFAVPAWCQDDAPTASKAVGHVGSMVEDFSLLDYRGTEHTLSKALADSDLVVLAFLGAECPLARLYGPRLEQLAEHFAGQRVSFLGVNSNRHDSLEEIELYVRRSGISFPLLKDSANKLADALAADRTPEVVVLDAERRIRYRGRIDDQYGVGFSRPAPTREDLKRALEELAAGEPVTIPQTTAVGCHIGRLLEPDSESAVTYGRQISRLLQRHCVECHRKGEIAPFPLTSYEEAVGWAETIREVISDQRMPPWHADPAHGNFINARLMTSDEKQLIYDWVKAGAPEGDPTAVPPARSYVRGWQLPQAPDHVIEMHGAPFKVAAEGTVEYQYFVVDPSFTEDKWIRAAEVVPGSRQVVHHAIVFVRPPNLDPSQGMGWLTAYVPGQSILDLPEGQAKLIPAGSQLVFQMHYTPNGSPQDDTTKIGLVEVDEASVREQVITMLAMNRNFEIPAGAGDHRVEATVSEFPKGSRLLAISPHMHLRGKSFRFNVQHDGESEILLDVPHYDFNWQHVYVLETPLALDTGVAIHCVGHFDNSTENLVNPDPSAVVRWGDQTWEEMMLGYMEISVPLDRGKPGQVFSQRELTAEEEIRAETAARKMIARFDRDKNNTVERGEVPDAFAVFAFRRFDRDKNRAITYEEALEVSRGTVRRQQLLRLTQ